MKRILLILILLFSLCSCSSYGSGTYTATMFKSICSDGECQASFGSFKGTYEFHLKNSLKEDGAIEYNVSLTKGNMYIYYQQEGRAKELFLEIKEGDSLSGFDGYIMANAKVIITFTTEETCKGSLNFKLKS